MSTLVQRFNPLDLLKKLKGLKNGGSGDGEDLPIRDWNPGPQGGAATRIAGFDTALVWCVVAMLSLGLVMVYSASVALPDSPKYKLYAPTFFLSRHALSLAIAFIAALVVVQLPIKLWERAAPYLFVASLALLLLVLIPGLGKGVNGARRWLPLGVMNFQPSELAKLAMAMYAASYMVRKMEVKERFIKAVWPMAVALGVIGVLLLAEPDMGAFVVIACVALGILFLGGVNGRMFAVSVAMLLGAMVVMIVTNPWRMQRALAFTDPFDPLYSAGKGYQLSHSLIAFGRGELTGQGLGGSVEKLHYLPEAHTDFLLAVIGEELGFLGVAAVIVAFFWLTRRIFVIGRQAVLLDRVFAGLMVQGIGIWIGGQTLINMGVNLGALPTKGLTLPLLSYGGSAILMNLVAMAIVVRVDIENRLLMRGGRE
ncbi:MAG TPA: putative lipid II flippase FtsW [Aquabacterium sp.]|nr:putative lipid II flippase FtsW [Aquabacterium sp.]HQC96409.1 putative lipid II flippase FtsW [Aquabacterium sp.]